MGAAFADDTGVQVLHNSDRAVVDICFVHDLNGGRISTWKKGEVFWPYNLLAKDIGDARILTWGYHADAAHFLSSTPISTNRVKDHARNLLNDLKGIRATPESSRRPIILIAHSLGGLVCAQGLLDSGTVEPDHVERLSNNTGALMFMGTPFEGSDAARWTGLFERLAKYIPTFTLNKVLLDHLKAESHDLKALGEEFPVWLKNRESPDGAQIRVMCFFEEFATSVGTIVPRESAQIGGNNAVALPADHSGICKYDNFEDPKYKTVLRILERWVEEIKAASSATKPDVQPAGSVEISMGRNYGGTQTGQDYSQNKREGDVKNDFRFGS